MAENYILDTETTGIANHPTHGHPQVIELCFIPFDFSTLYLYRMMELNVKDISFTLLKEATIKSYRPSMPIQPEATKIPGKKFIDLMHYPTSESLQLPAMKHMIAHNVSYDHRCLGKPNVKTVCTLSLVKDLNKFHKLGITSFTLDDLIVFFYDWEANIVKSETHSAFVDCVKVFLLLLKLLPFMPKVTTVEELYNFQQLLKANKVRKVSR